MKKSPKAEYPYKNLGLRIKNIRQKSAQSLTEVSGAVEIDESRLNEIEAGLIKPSQETLEMLAGHFNLKEKEALNLLELAGYSSEDPKSVFGAMIENGMTRTIIMMLSQESKIAYTDSLEINYDSSGLVFNFKQRAGHSSPVTVARLAMSYDQAKEVQKTLGLVLKQKSNQGNSASKSRPSNKSKKS
jgi:transcriptional regulator with XRE-family HTH domain